MAILTVLPGLEHIKLVARPQSPRHGHNATNANNYTEARMSPEKQWHALVRLVKGDAAKGLNLRQGQMGI